MPAITLTDLTFSYTAQPLLDHVSLSVGDGERACVVGPNGCGKTTLLRLVTGDLVPDSGSGSQGPVTPACADHPTSWTRPGPWATTSPPPRPGYAASRTASSR